MQTRQRIIRAVADLDRRVRPWAACSPLNAAAYEFLLFGLKQAWACLFGGAMLGLIVATHYLYPPDIPLARYDVLVIAAVCLQALLLYLRLERPDEAVVILIFHIVGTAMELFKTSQGSWIYPEHSALRIGGVPLFSGFMYASVGSYIARIWRIFDIRFTRYPPVWATWVLAVGAYVNFFSHHFAPDIRLGLFALAALLFGRTWFWFKADRVHRPMPFLLGAVLVALFIWLAENLGTFASAWIYPSQAQGWTLVPIEKMGAWFLLIMLSFVLVTVVNPPRPYRRDASPTCGSRRPGSDPAADDRS